MVGGRCAPPPRRPTIVGPVAWPADARPPRFRVDAAGLPLYMVELAAARHLMINVAHRTGDNYFYGGDPDSVFAAGPGWRVPAGVWARLAGAAVLYYRVIAIDQASGRSALSVDDHQLNTLPALIVTRAPSNRPAYG